MLAVPLVLVQVAGFGDLQTHWAKDCIAELGDRRLVSGYPDRTFRPQNSLTRAEFAVLMLNSFPQVPVQRPAQAFQDVPSSHWAHRAIQDAYQRSLFTGYPGNRFLPEQPIPRVQAIAVIASALDPRARSATANPSAVLQAYYQDAAAIPSYAQGVLATASVNSWVVNHPEANVLRPNVAATRGEVAALLCRALNIYRVPGETIAGVRVRRQPVRALPGQLDRVPVFNSNSPELVRQPGILLSTFPPDNKRVPAAHLNYGFSGSFDLFSHHLSRAETATETWPPLPPFYQGILVHNPSPDRAVTLEILQAATALSTPEAPFIELPEQVENPQNRVYAGPGSRVAGDLLQGRRSPGFPVQQVIPPGGYQLLFQAPIPVERAPASNGRSLLMQLRSDGLVYLANLAQRGRNPSGTALEPPTLADWRTLLEQGELAGPRDSTPTPLDPPRHPTVFGRVAGVSEGSRWQAKLSDPNPSNPNPSDLQIPAPGSALSYVLGTLPLITLATQQIQSAPMRARYPDTAYLNHSNYGVTYELTLPLYNSGDRPQTVALRLETPLKDEAGPNQLLFLPNPIGQRIFFRGTVKVTTSPATTSPLNTGPASPPAVTYWHLVQRRGQPGPILAQVVLQQQERRSVQVAVIYPADVTPPQVLTVETLMR